MPRVAGRVVGIDPGLNVTGYAVVEPSPRGPFVVEAGVIRTRGRKTLGERLARIHQGVMRGARRLSPPAVALEQVHSHVRHPRTAILMAHARGVIVLAAEREDAVVGYAATRIKKTLTGSGRAPKDQIQHAIKTELGLDQLPEPHDVADACAVALCHFHINRNQHGLKRTEAALEVPRSEAVGSGQKLRARLGRVGTFPPCGATALMASFADFPHDVGMIDAPTVPRTGRIHVVTPAEIVVLPVLKRVPQTDRNALSLGHGGGLTDGQLLERFLERREDAAEAAFAALVDRQAHGFAGLPAGPA